MKAMQEGIGRNVHVEVEERMHDVGAERTESADIQRQSIAAK